MRKGGTIVATVSLLAVTACVTDQAKIEVRAKPTALAAGKQPVPARIAEADGHLALNNVALALEAYRKAWRDDPQSLAALSGMAACYDRMGRHDLSRRYFETALAVAPGDPALLTAFAHSLQNQGKLEEAQAVRHEIAARLARAAEPAETLAQAEPREEAEEAIALAPLALPTLAETSLASVSALAVEVDERTAAVPEETRAALAPAAVRQPAAKPMPVAAASVTIKLPPPRPVSVASAPPAAAVVAAVAPVVSAPSRAPAPVKTSPKPVPVSAEPDLSPVGAPPKPMRVARTEPVTDGPRLERLSMGEVALVTKSRSQWQPLLVRAEQRSATVRFVPLRNPAPRYAVVRLLNAARYAGLAARTRNYLVGRGWRSLTIGDAPTTRSASVVLYPAGRATTARRLAAQFGFPMKRVATGSHVTVLLGRDAAAKAALKARV